jgi:1-deoxy-D-xylulose-5-phosphate reductoisomerase
MSERVTILGATGSVGRSTAEVLLQHRDRFQVAAIVAGGNAPALAKMARELGAGFAAVADVRRGAELKAELAGSGIACGAGPEAVREAAEREADIVVAAVCGVAGLEPTWAALAPGRRVALANKESLVCAGQAFMGAAERIGATILPLDSEHNALRQAIAGGHPDDILTMTITASGGPFRTWTRERMAGASPAQAGRHPVWSMGAKINIDSASLMNKGLELIEAHHLFGIDDSRLDVVVHPQSIIHGLVHWRDGAVTAELANPDMKVPIANCLGTARRIDLDVPRLDLAAIGSFTFEAPDEVRFPCLRLARHALREGGALPTLLNGANEIAVEAFLAGQIGFLDIAHVVEEVCAAGAGRSRPAPASMEEALSVDAEARRLASGLLPRFAAPVASVGM